MAEKTPVQQKYIEAKFLKKHGLPSVNELVRATSGDPEDFAGIVLAHSSGDHKNYSLENEDRLLGMAGMGSNGDGIIGFGLIFQDIQHALKVLRDKVKHK